MIALAYNTNGLRNLNLDQAVHAVAATGYQGIELSLHPSHIDPFTFTDSAAARLRQLLNDLDLRACCLATGADHLLGPERYEPSLIHPTRVGRQRRIDLIRRSIDLAAMLGVPVVNFASGIRQADVPIEEAWDDLVSAIRQCADHARGVVTLAIEPEPGFYVETNLQAAALVREVASDAFRINQDIGHANVVEDDYVWSIRQHASLTAHVHIEDIKDRRHFHEIPGDGHIDFRAVYRALREGGYDGFVSVELYNHASVYETALRRSLAHLRQMAA